MAKQKRKNNPLKFFTRKVNIKIILLLLFFAAIFLRSVNLGNTLFFGPEQGVDFWRMKTIAVDHTPVLVGAKTDIAGVFHGPLYYYISSIPFVMSHGDPIFIAFFLIVINAATVFFIYLASLRMFNKRLGIIAALFFTISFGAISYTHWLSSHPLVLPLSALFLLGMTEFLNGRKKFLILASISYALLGQAEFLNYLLFGGVIITLILFFFKAFKKTSLRFLILNIFIIFVFGVLHYVIFELRNQFIMTKSLLALSHGNGYYVGLLKVVQLTYEQFSITVTGVILPFFPSSLALIFLIAGIIVLALSKYAIAKKLLISSLFVPMVILILLRHDILEQFFVYSVIPCIIITAFLMDFIINKKKIIGYLSLGALVLIQIYAWYRYVPSDQYMFFESTQPDITINDEKKIIDTIYQKQRGQNFSFQSYTIPYWSQQAWEYLFWQYGKSKYGYLPVNQNGKVLYVIVQDDPSSTKYQNDWLKYTVAHWGTYRDSFRIGTFTVRRLTVP